MNWRLEANCQETESEIFFADPIKEPMAVRVAKNICSQCCVMDECLNDALESKSLGIWAGTDEYERARLLEMPIRRREKIFNYSEYHSTTRELGVK